jgi:ribose 5-phosphate isomerase A
MKSDIWLAAREASEMIEPGMIVGLGTGRAASMFVRALAERVGAGLRIKGIPTSKKTEALARELSIPLCTLEDVDHIDVDVDGADEVSPSLDLIKGHGGALLRERIVASISSRFVIVVGEQKLVDSLGTRVDLPVEVVPFGVPVAQSCLEKISKGVNLRLEGGTPYLTDNGNVILNVAFDAIADPAALERAVDAVPGVVDSGLFVGMADVVLVQTDSGVKRIERKKT